MKFHLSKRLRPSGTIYFYACRDYTDKVAGKRKKEQHAIGSVKGGFCQFNDKALEYSELFVGTEYERQYQQWHKMRKTKNSKEMLFSRSDVAAIKSYNSGIYLICSTQVRKLRLDVELNRIFGKDLAADVLSLVYFLVRGTKEPLYHATWWSMDQKLPCKTGLDQERISGILQRITLPMVQEFLYSWIKRFPRDERLSMDLTSVSSYSRNISDVQWNYSYHHKGGHQQVNLLMAISQNSKMPVWIGHLPDIPNDVSALEDLMTVACKKDGSPYRFVFDRGFASTENLGFMIQKGMKFTIGMPLNIWTSLHEEAQQLLDAKVFFRSEAILDGSDCNSFPVYAVTKCRYIHGGWVYDHFFYSEQLARKDNVELTKMIEAVSQKLQKGEIITNPAEQAVAETCFIVKDTPRRQRSVRILPDAVALFRKRQGRFFVLRSNQFKLAKNAFRAYQYRDGIERQFDDIKNQGDMKRLRVHSEHNLKARLFLQFLAQILRCDAQQMLEKSNWAIPGVKSVSDFYKLAESIRTVELPGHRPINKRPTKLQLTMLDIAGVPTSGPTWPSL